MKAGEARLGLFAIFASTFFELVGYFMLLPLLLLRLKGADVSTTVAGLFAATGWAGIFLFTPFASWVTQRLGRRPTLWLSAAIPAVAAVGFAFTEALVLWFALQLLSGAASGLRWVLSEAVVAEFSPPGQRGRYVGIFETMVGATFVIGPAVLVWVGPGQPAALWAVIGFMLVGLCASLLIPKVPAAADAHSAKVGLGGVWQALIRHPIIMLAGFVGGFFESGITSILPLYGLALGLGAAACCAAGVGQWPGQCTDDAAGRHAGRPLEPQGGGPAQHDGHPGVRDAGCHLRHSLRGPCAGAGLAHRVPVGRCGRQPVHAGHDRHRFARAGHRAGEQHRGAGADLHAGWHGRLGRIGRLAAVVAHLRVSGAAGGGGAAGLRRLAADTPPRRHLGTPLGETLQHVDGIDAQRVDRITAFEHEHGRQTGRARSSPTVRKSALASWKPEIGSPS
jgi:hypothetical protein